MSNERPQAVTEDPNAPIFAVSMQRYVQIGMIAALVLVLGFGGWAAMANIAGAVVAPGTVSVGSRVKEVQHREGGIVSEIFVDNGDRVSAGDVLIELDDTQSRAARDMVKSQLVSYRARMDRLIAERDKADAITFRDEVMDRADEPVISELIAGQRGIFAARRATLEGQSAQFNEQLSQLTEQVAGLEGQRLAKQREIVLVNDELGDLRQLLERDLVPRSRVVAREREAVRLEGEEGELTARIATARGRSAEIRLQILQLEKEFQQTVFDDIEQLQTEIATLNERNVAADDELARVIVKAPVSGIVHDMTVSTIGGVVPPGGTILEVVPEEDDLVISARASPINVDEIAPGQEADVMFSGLPFDSTPKLRGTVKTVSADTKTDEQTGMEYFSVNIVLPDTELQRLGENVVLTPGMPADVFIRTRDRTVLNYLVEPLLDAANVAFRET